MPLLNISQRRNVLFNIKFEFVVRSSPGKKGVALDVGFILKKSDNLSETTLAWRLTKKSETVTMTHICELLRFISTLQIAVFREWFAFLAVIWHGCCVLFY